MYTHFIFLVQQQNLDDVEEVDDDDDDFNPYSTPDPEIVKLKAERRKLEEQSLLKSSENQKLLKTALEDLSGDESPPEIPKQAFSSEDTVKSPSQISVGSQKVPEQVSDE